MKVHTIHLCPKKNCERSHSPPFVCATILGVFIVSSELDVSRRRRWLRWTMNGLWHKAREQENWRHKTSNWIWLHRWALLKLFLSVRQRMMCVVWTSTAHTCDMKLVGIRCLVFMEHWVQFENSPFARSHFHSSFGTLLCAWVEKGQEQRTHETFFCKKNRNFTSICTTMREVSFFDGFYAQLQTTTMTRSFW